VVGDNAEKGGSMTIELTQVEVNFIRGLIQREPSVQRVLEDGMSTGDLYRHRVIVALLEKLPHRETTVEEREESYKEVGVTPNDQFTRAIRSSGGFQW
jgi:hypothetical protein